VAHWDIHRHRRFSCNDLDSLLQGPQGPFSRLTKQLQDLEMAQRKPKQQVGTRKPGKSWGTTIPFAVVVHHRSGCWSIWQDDDHEGKHIGAR
jgi:hypothetical protein